MTINVFLFLLAVFSAMTGVIVEALKKFVMDKDNKKYNLMALIVALIVGFIGVLLWYHFNGLPVNGDTYLLAILMGIASGLTSMTSYDKIKQCIEQLAVKK